MKILIVCDQYQSPNNGLTISIRRFADTLRNRGNEVRILGCSSEEVRSGNISVYPLRKQYIPVFDRLVSSQGMTFAKPDREIIREAVAWADIIHIATPFVLSHRVIKEAKKQNKPFTSAFHVQPENITSSIHLGKANLINFCIYKGFHGYIYKYCGHIHCPSRFIAGELKNHGYKERLHIISNGIDPDFKYIKMVKSPELEGKFVILMIGRLSVEKRQDVLISAVKKSKHSDNIQIILAGKGPRKEYLLKQAKGLKNEIIINFFTKDELIKTIALSDLYVHAADMEIEAMSCMEAFACGLVPVISDSKKSATPQFALDNRSLFKAGDSGSLAEKIDYWYEHEAERKEAELKYAELAKKYSLYGSVTETEKMFEAAINDNRRR